MLPMFTFQGQLAADDVLETTDVKVSEDSEGLRPEDEVLLRFLQRYILCSLTQSGMVCPFFYNDCVYYQGT